MNHHHLSAVKKCRWSKNGERKRKRKEETRLNQNESKSTNRGDKASFPTMKESSRSIAQSIAVSSIKVGRQTTSPFIPADEYVDWR